jgi:hypothetical protein
MERVYTTPLLDKLGIRPGARVAIADVDDADFRALLGERTDDVTDLGPEDLPPPDTDIVMLGAESVTDLGRLDDLQRTIRRNGAIWVVWRKGKSATLRDVDVIDAAISVGLVDNKVASFSATHTAQRLVIPLARRTG